MTKCTDPDKLGRMVREISAGGGVVRRGPEGWGMAAVEPQKEPPAGGKTAKKKVQKKLHALPKGVGGPGRKARADSHSRGAGGNWADRDSNYQADRYQVCLCALLGRQAAGF